LNELDNQIRGRNTEIRDNRTRLQGHVPTGMSVEAFIGLLEDEEIDPKIAAKEQELQAVQRVAQLQQRAGLIATTVPVFPAAFAELLAKTFRNVTADAEQRVAEHIACHAMQARGETWLTEGLRYVASDECPFCGQGLDGVDLIQAYSSFFSREYRALRDEVTGLSNQVGGAIGDRVAAAVDQTVLQNANNLEFWRQYCEIAPLVPPETGRAGEVMMALRQSAQSLLEVKAGTPLDAVAPDMGFTEALVDFEALRTSLATYNAGVAAANAVITARKQQAQVGESARRGKCSCQTEGAKGSVSACASWRIPVVMGYAPGCFRGMKRDAVPGMSINGGQASV